MEFTRIKKKKKFILESLLSSVGYKVLRRGNIDPDGTYIITVHPHGTWPIISSFYTLDYKKIFGLDKYPITSVSDIVLYMPLAGNILYYLGADSCKRSTIEHNLKKGHSIIIYPGGEDELMRSKPGSEIVCIKHRKGIFDIAIKESVSIVPTLCYYESDLYLNWSNVPIRKLMKKYLGTSFQFTWGHPFMPWYPRSYKILEVVVGDPIYSTNIEEFKEKYIKSIKNLRAKYPPTEGQREFEII